MVQVCAVGAGVGVAAQNDPYAEALPIPIKSFIWVPQLLVMVKGVVNGRQALSVVTLN